MKKLLIPFVAAFGLSLGGSTGLVMVRAPKAAAHAVPAKPGSKTKPDSAKVDSVKAAAPVDSTHPVSTDSASKQATPQADKMTTTPVAPAAAPAPSTPVKTSAAPASTKTAAATGGGDVRADAAKLNKVAAVAQQIQPTDSMVGRKLAQIFSAMPPKDAARVLEQMDDSDVRTIIASLGNKQQAAILGNFPTQRAAGIVRATLRAPGSAK